MCDGTTPSPWSVSGGFSLFSTDIVFGGQRVSTDQQVASVSASRFSSPRFGWAASVGGIVNGTVEGRDIKGGATAGATAIWLPLFETDHRPFVAVTGSLSAAYLRAVTDANMTHSWTAFDLRVGAMAGKTFFDRLVPYVAVRAFGGPVSWQRGGQSVTGGDRYHITVGGGATLRLPSRFEISLEAMPLGERGFGATLGHRL
jgi:hypothetical protein